MKISRIYDTHGIKATVKYSGGWDAEVEFVALDADEDNQYKAVTGNGSLVLPLIRDIWWWAVGVSRSMGARYLYFVAPDLRRFRLYLRLLDADELDWTTEQTNDGHMAVVVELSEKRGEA